MARMNQHDWDELTEQWSNAVLSQELDPNKPESKSTEYKYLYIQLTTYKAKFYVIKEGMIGWWVPNQAIIFEDNCNNIVKIADWCKLKEIQFVESRR